MVKLSKLLKILRWVFPRINSLLYSKPREGKRRLIIYDLARQPFSIGDFLIAHLGGMIIREVEKLSQIDCAIVYDESLIGQNRPMLPEELRINRGNIKKKILSLIPAALANQHIGSLFVFDSHIRLENFIADNMFRYHVWPNFWDYITRESLYRPVNDLFCDFYEKYGWIPSLNCNPDLRDWANKFFKSYARALIPVTVNIRYNQWYAPHRNTDFACWVDFFKQAGKKFPVVFIIIAALDEIPDEIRKCENVLIAKDHHTTIDQDLALIQAAPFHMGTASGPATIAIYSNKPYLLVNSNMLEEGNLTNYKNARKTDNIVQLSFASHMQKFLLPPEKPELLLREFCLIMESLDKRPLSCPKF